MKNTLKGRNLIRLWVVKVIIFSHRNKLIINLRSGILGCIRYCLRRMKKKVINLINPLSVLESVIMIEKIMERDKKGL